MPAARAFARHGLTAAGASEDVVDRMVLAVAEACNNAILHAGGDEFTVAVSAEGGRIVVTVSDDGSGFRPPARWSMPGPHSLGQRGLALMNALVDHVDVASTAQGTTVTLAHAFPVPGGTDASVPASGQRSSLAG